MKYIEISFEINILFQEKQECKGVSFEQTRKLKVILLTKSYLRTDLFLPHSLFEARQPHMISRSSYFLRDLSIIEFLSQIRC